MSVTAYADNDLVEKVYRQLAKVYDVAFGAILQSGGRARFAPSQPMAPFAYSKSASARP